VSYTGHLILHPGSEVLLLPISGVNQLLGWLFSIIKTKEEGHSIMANQLRR
jgi:hypothetical protein